MGSILLLDIHKALANGHIAVVLLKNGNTVKIVKYNYYLEDEGPNEDERVLVGVGEYGKTVYVGENEATSFTVE